MFAEKAGYDDRPNCDARMKLAGMVRKKKLINEDTMVENQASVDEKRLAHRYTMSLDTEVHFHEQCVTGMFRCRTENIGLNSVFLSSDAMPITSKTDIELVFRAPVKPRLKQYCIGAKVVRNAADGAALVFCPENEQQIQGLRLFLLRAKVAIKQ